MQGLTAPTVTVNEGDVWSYPLYDAWWLRGIYVTGSYLWVYIYSIYAFKTSNKVYNETLIIMARDISRYGYLVHYLFIVIVASYVVKPL